MKYTLINPINKNYTAMTQVLTNRGIEIDCIDDFMNPTDDHLYSEDLLENIEVAAKCILRNIAQGNRIHIQVDSDCDGYTSAALLINYLYTSFPARVQNCVTYGLHEGKQHGIGDIPDGVHLVIAPDSSSNEYDLHKELNNNAVNIVVLDHHHAELCEDDPAVIVNNQTCDYPNKALSGVGIVYKTCKVMDRLLHKSYADDFLDLVALGMTADMMDTRELETRRLIIKGFQEIRNPFFRKMVEKNGFTMKGKVNQHTVAWYVAPFINAITRTGTMEEKELIFKSMLIHEAHKLIPSTKRGCKGQEELLVEQAIRTCTNVKARQEKQKTELLDFVQNRGTHGSPMAVWTIILPRGQFETGLTGLVANQLMAEYKVPVLLLHETDNGYEGSGRGFDTGVVKDWRQFCEENGAMYAEGHAMAFGVGFTEEGLAEFHENVQNKIGLVSGERNFDVDFIWKWTDKYDDAIRELGQAGEDIWGQGVSEPYVVIENIPVSRDNIKIMGKGTVRIDIPGHDTNCIKFGGEAVYELITARLGDSNDTTIDVTICGQCAINEWNGNITPQIRISDFDIVSGPKWNF